MTQHSKKADIDDLIKEFEEGYEIAKDLSPSVTVLGSARLKEDNVYYEAARKLGKEFSKHGINIITGGGGGIMEAANRGAFENNNSKSIGFNINLPQEQAPNPYVHIEYEFDHFYSRKYMLFNFCDTIVVFPGGFGTLDEFFEVLMLMQTQKLSYIKVYLYSIEFWSPMIESLEEALVENEVIHPYDMEMFILTDSIDDIVKETAEIIL